VLNVVVSDVVDGASLGWNRYGRLDKLLEELIGSSVVDGDFDWVAGFSINTGCLEVKSEYVSK
jgi:hypothetical protein